MIIKFGLDETNIGSNSDHHLDNSNVIIHLTIMRTFHNYLTISFLHPWPSIWTWKDVSFYARTSILLMLTIAPPNMHMKPLKVPWKSITNIYVPTFIKVINLPIECYDIFKVCSWLKNNATNNQIIWHLEHWT
jgi:hypothetical protein